MLHQLYSQSLREKTVYDNFSKEILKSYLSQNQFAYRQGGSCINALIKMHHNILKALDNSKTKAVRLFSMDLSKTFDNVKHSLFVEELKVVYHKRKLFF